MILHKLRLSHFRNFSNLEMHFSPGINSIIGKNGHGKTNLLESIFCLALSKSFRTANDADLVQLGQSSFEIHGTLISELAVENELAIVYLDGKKSVRQNQKRLPRHSALIGIAPMVLFSPEDHRVTSGSPAERRLFLDVLLSQADQKYLSALQSYARIVRQRNRLLSLIAEGEQSPAQLDSWDAAIVPSGMVLIEARNAFLQQIEAQLQKTYTEISGNSVRLHAQYRFAEDAVIEDDESYVRTLQQQHNREIKRKQTLVGPHRDDVVFVLGERDVKKHASRGEQKSVLLALKIIEFEYLKNKKQSTPIFLIDDLQSELDEGRQVNLLSRLTDIGQTFITSTEQMQPRGREDSAYVVDNGTLKPMSDSQT